MNGYVKNVSAGWIHIFKQGLGPNCSIKLDALYTIYGVKNGLKEGEDFVQWLRDIKLKNRPDCKLVYDPSKTQGKKVVDSKESGVSEVQQEVGETAKASEKTSNNNPPPVIKVKAKEDEVTAITGLTVHKAKAALARISNLQLLKTALQQARQMPNRDTLCRLLDKRILELEQYF